MPWAARIFSAIGFCACHSLYDASKPVATNGTESAPNTGFSFSSRLISTCADLRLAGLHGALDLRRLEQRAAGVHGDGQLAAGGLGDIAANWLRFWVCGLPAG